LNLVEEGSLSVGRSRESMSPRVVRLAMGWLDRREAMFDVPRLWFLSRERRRLLDRVWDRLVESSCAAAQLAFEVQRDSRQIADRVGSPVACGCSTCSRTRAAGAAWNVSRLRQSPCLLV
jgi:hypothetical protein